MVTNRLALVENSSTETDRPLRDSLRVNAAYGLFFLGASWLTASVLFGSLSRRSSAASLQARQKISAFSAGYLDRLARMGCIHCDYEGFEDCADWRGSLICANHPSIFDALLLFQKFPDANCVVGANPWSHPLFSILARQAAYIPSLPALGMVKETRRVIKEGGNIIVFPEGTRTREGALGPFQDGFALAAIKSGAAVRTIFIECTSRFLGKAITLQSPLEMPIRFRLSAGEVFHPSPGENARAFSHALEQYFHARLVREGEAIRRSEPRA